jgi:diadenosine tetraphosphate (Ap4A) HIT family hydrolase
MSLLGDALLSVTGAHRINYEILGNSERALHAHLFPRYETEPDHLKTVPVWHYDFSKAISFDPEKHAQFITAMKKKLNELGALI